MDIKRLDHKDLRLYILNKKSDEDYAFIKKHSEKIFEILKTTYDKIGGCYNYKTPKKMLEMASRYKIVMNEKQEIFGVATYRHFIKDDSYKCILIGRNFDLDENDSKISVQWIIKSDIINWKKLYWIEAYDAVGHWENKYGAFKIPAVYATDILGNLDIKLDDKDEYTYYRQIPGIEEPQPKIMFGVDSKDTLEKLLLGEKYSDYEKYVQELFDGKIHNSLYESKITKFDEFRYEAVLRTLDFIEDRYDEQEQFRNVSPKTLEIMKSLCRETKKILASNKLSSEEKKELKPIYKNCLEITQKANVIIPYKLFEKQEETTF